MTSVAGPQQTPTKRGNYKETPPLIGGGHGTKQEKNRSRTRTTPRKDRFEPMETKEMEASISQTGKIQMNTKMKNQEAHSKCPQEQLPIRINKHCNAQESTKPLQRT